MKLSRQEMLKKIKVGFWKDFLGREHELDNMPDKEIESIYNSLVAQDRYIANRDMRRLFRSQTSK